MAASFAYQICQLEPASVEFVWLSSSCAFTIGIQIVEWVSGIPTHPQFESWWNGSQDTVLHHKLTMVFLHPESIIRQQLNFFVRGKPLRLLPDLHNWVCRLKLIPVSERPVEAPHSFMHKFAVYKHCTTDSQTTRY